MADDVSVEERLSAIFAIEGRNWPHTHTHTLDCNYTHANMQPALLLPVSNGNRTHPKISGEKCTNPKLHKR